MSEIKRMGDYSLKEIGSGGETRVYRPRNSETGTPEKGIVIKNFDIDDEHNEHGFDDDFKRELEDHHRKLKAEYGDLFPKMRIVKNPDHPDRNILVQEYVDTAKPAPVADYYPVDIEDAELQKRLARLVQTIKKNMRLLRADQPAILPDLRKDNLVFTKNQDRMVFLDSGTNQDVLITADRVLLLACLEMLGGVPFENLKHDSFYQKVFARFPELVTMTDEHEIYNTLLEHEKELEADLDQNEIEVEIG